MTMRLQVQGAVVHDEPLDVPLEALLLVLREVHAAGVHDVVESSEVVQASRDVEVVVRVRVHQVAPHAGHDWHQVPVDLNLHHNTVA